MVLICIQNSVRWVPTATTPLRLDCCSVHLEETDGDQQRLSVRHVDDDEDGPGLYANVNAKGGQLQQTDPGTQTPDENVYMNVQDTKVKRALSCFIPYPILLLKIKCSYQGQRSIYSFSGL